MLVRLRLDEYTGGHASLTVFEGREHGAKLGDLRLSSGTIKGFAKDLGVTIAYEDQDPSEKTLRVGDTIEAELSAKAVVRRGGMEVRS
jgi:hypothetical protein